MGVTLMNLEASAKAAAPRTVFATQAEADAAADCVRDGFLIVDVIEWKNARRPGFVVEIYMGDEDDRIFVDRL